MYFWNIEQLKQDIKNDRLTEQQRFVYLFIYVVFTACALELYTFVPYEESDLNLVVSILSVAIQVVGTYVLYKINGGALGKAFLGKYFSIGCVVTIRFIVFCFPVSLVGAVLFAFGISEITGVVGDYLFDAAVYTLFNLVFYIYFAKHFRQSL